MKALSFPRFLTLAVCGLWGALSAGALADSIITISDLEKTGPSQGSLLVTIDTTDTASALEVDLVFDPNQVDVTEPGSIKVPNNDQPEADYNIAANTIEPGKMRVVLSSPRLTPLVSGTSFRIPVSAAIKGADIQDYLPVTLSNIELSNNAGARALAKKGATVRIRGMNGGKIDGKPGLSLGLDLLKEEGVEVTQVEYYVNGQRVQTATGAAAVTWKPNGSGSFQLSSKVTLSDGSTVTSRPQNIVVTGLATPSIKATYSGGVMDATSAKAAAATGSIQVTTTSIGSYSVRLILNGQIYAASGRFNAESVATPVINARALGKALRLHFQQEAVGFSDKITGLVTDGTLDASGEASGGSFVSRFEANRSVWNVTNQPVDLVGKYTVVLPQNGEALEKPNGIATVTIGNLGTALGLITLSDNTRLTQVTPLSKDGLWEPYVSLYKRTGFLSGSVDFSDKGQNGDVGGVLDWRMDASSLMELDAVGGRFISSGTLLPVKGGPSNLSVTISGGSLTTQIQKLVTLSPTNGVSVPRPNDPRLVLRFDKVRGGFSGVFFHPVLNRTVSFNGVLLQGEQKGIGYFGGTDGLELGSVELTPVP